LQLLLRLLLFLLQLLLYLLRLLHILLPLPYAAAPNVKVRVATRRMANLLFAFRIGTGTSFCVASLIVAPHFGPQPLFVHPGDHKI
jgi:hypothetical protein